MAGGFVTAEVPVMAHPLVDLHAAPKSCILCISVLMPTCGTVCLSRDHVKYVR